MNRPGTDRRAFSRRTSNPPQLASCEGQSRCPVHSTHCSWGSTSTSPRSRGSTAGSMTLTKSKPTSMPALTWSRCEFLALRNEQATREAVIDGFRGHLAGAGPGDVTLFYYAGHGSQEQAPEQFWHLEPDRLDETLVCYDSRTPGCWDLADKELARLIDEVTDRAGHVAVILDCCHSGAGTRGELAEGVTIRRAPIDGRIRPLDSFLAGVVEEGAGDSRAGCGRRALPARAGRLAPGAGTSCWRPAATARRPRSTPVAAGAAAPSPTSSSTPSRPSAAS